MPVIVVPAQSGFAHALCEELLATGGQVRAFVHDADAASALRELGVHVAIGGWLDVERLESACAQVHTLIHLTGDQAGRRPSDEKEAFEVTAIAAHAADVARIVVGLPASGRARSQAEEAIKMHGQGKSFEVVAVPLAGTDGERIQALIAADARE